MAGDEAKEEKVNMSGQDVRDIPSSLLLRAKEIAHLDLSDNPDLQLSASIAAFINLKVLNLSCTRLASVPDELQLLTQLTSLDLSGNELTALPDCLSKLLSLTSVFLAWNRLTTLTDLGKLSALTSLNLSANGLTALPNSLGKLIALTSLDLSKNKLTTLPDCLGNLTSLTSLVASNNCFSSYPMVTMKLQLNKLDLSNKIRFLNRNTIRHLPIELSSSTSLHKLDLRGNPMVRPPLEICVQGTDAIRKYLKELSLGVSTVCPQTVSMLGETEAGKTSIVMSLYDGQPHRAGQEARTRVMSQTQIYHSDDRVLVINDFGGHTIYQSVLEVFLPPKGIGIIVYDMSEPFETQTETVDCWMTTAFAKSPALKLIIVGSHLDCPHENDEERCKSTMQAFVATKVTSTLEELKRHMRKVEQIMQRSQHKIPSRALKNKVKTLKVSLSLVEENKCPVCFVSCLTGVGIEDLRNLVFNMVGPSFEFPTHWAKVVEELFNPDNEKHQQASYLKMDEAQAIYQDIVSSEQFSNAQESQAELKDDGLNIILVFLSEISRILWKCNHPTLGNCIFHRILHVVEICKAVLHHDTFLDKSLSAADKEDLKLYERGRLTEDLLERLLQPFVSPFSCAEVFVKLLAHFNLISLVKDNHSMRMFIVPSLLPTEPGNFAFSPHEPHLHARFDFYGKAIPQSFFETYTAAVLQKVDELVMLNADCWKDGVGFESCGVKLLCRRLKDKYGKQQSEMILDSSSSASNLLNLWKVSWRVICGLQNHIMHTWKGAYCRGYFPCPGCQLSRKDNFNSFPFDVELIGIDNPPEHYLFKCCTCGIYIPRALITVCSSESITDRDCKDVRDFFVMHGGCTGRTIIEPLRQLRKNFSQLVKEMSDLDAVIRHLYSGNVLTAHQKEDLKACQVPSEKADLLLSILEKKPEDSIVAFVEALRETNQHHLAALFQFAPAEGEKG